MSEQKRGRGFTFKQFHVAHEGCAMKVGTDGVLLGAWAPLPRKGRVLDVGSGSGLLSLMLAQRAQQLVIDAIDLDLGAYQQSLDNFAHSPWAERLSAHHCSMQQWRPKYGYNLVISNPPYFPPGQDFDRARQRARHSAELDAQDFFASLDALVTADAECALVLPASQQELWLSAAQQCQWYLKRRVQVSSVVGKEVNRVLLLLSRQAQQASETQLSIQHPDQSYTADFIALSKDFYLKM